MNAYIFVCEVDRQGPANFTGHIRGYYDGTSPADISDLIRDIRPMEKN